MRNRIMTSIVAVAAAVLLDASPQSPVRTLDLTTRPELTDPSDSASSQGGGVASVRKAVLPLRLHLEELDRSSYRRTDQVVFTVSLENYGRQPVTIPWSVANSDLRQRPLRQTSRAALGLYVGDRSGDLHLVAGIQLIGVRGTKDTLVTLKPGERVRIKAPSSFVFTDATGALLAGVAPNPIPVFAAMNVVEGTETTYQRIVSTDHLEATIFPE
jgi:hypothetical protein